MPRLIIFMLIVLLPEYIFAGQFDGEWSYESTREDGIHFSHSLTLIQQDNNVCGYWTGGNSSKVWEGFIHGIVRGDRLYAFTCTIENFNFNSPNLGKCEDDQSAKPDVYYLHNNMLDFHRYNNGGQGTGYGFYISLTRTSNQPTFDLDSDFSEYCLKHSNINVDRGESQTLKPSKSRKKTP